MRKLLHELLAESRFSDLPGTRQNNGLFGQVIED
jgi:hypothetical protein